MSSSCTEALPLDLHLQNRKHATDAKPNNQAVVNGKEAEVGSLDPAKPLDPAARRKVLGAALATEEQSNEVFLQKCSDRLDRCAEHRSRPREHA